MFLVIELDVCIAQSFLSMPVRLRHHRDRVVELNHGAHAGCAINASRSTRTSVPPNTGHDRTLANNHIVMVDVDAELRVAAHLARNVESSHRLTDDGGNQQAP